jgi:hypothetical protein
VFLIGLLLGLQDRSRMLALESAFIVTSPRQSSTSLSWSPG